MRLVLIRDFNKIEWAAHLCFTNRGDVKRKWGPYRRGNDSAIGKFFARRGRCAESRLAACGGSRAGSRFDPKRSLVSPPSMGAAAPKPTFCGKGHTAGILP